MKKSNKLTFVYILSSVLLFIVLIGGGVYGIYLSVGLNFMRSRAGEFSGLPNAVNNVSFSGTVNVAPTMIGVVILSIVLIILSIFDFVSMIKQVVLFKQFKMIRESKFEHGIEKKVKSKGAVLFFAFLIDGLSIIAGVVGLLLNFRNFAGVGVYWVLNIIDIFIVVFSIMSFVLLIIKLKKTKKQNEENKEVFYQKNNQTKNIFDIDKIEYDLLKLKYLKTSKMITIEEYDSLRKKLFNEGDSLKSKIHKVEKEK